jgi:hypothetical protein
MVKFGMASGVLAMVGFEIRSSTVSGYMGISNVKMSVGVNSA